MKLSKLRRPALVLGIFALAVLSVSPSKTSNPSGQIPPEVVNFMAAYGADAVTIDRGSRDYKLPNQIQWQGRPGTANQSAVVFGDPSKPGLYITLLNAGRTTGVSLTLIRTIESSTSWLGPCGSARAPSSIPTRRSPSKLAATSTISLVSRNYDGTKEDGLTIEITGMGPATSIPAAGK